MEPQAHQTLKETLARIKQVRDADVYGDKERDIVIDVAATLRTLIDMYSSPDEVLPQEEAGMLDSINPFKRRG